MHSIYQFALSRFSSYILSVKKIFDLVILNSKRKNIHVLIRKRMKLKIYPKRKDVTLGEICQNKQYFNLMLDFHAKEIKSKVCVNLQNESTNLLKIYLFHCLFIRLRFKIRL